MTEIERKALALVNEVMRERGHGQWVTLSREREALSEALCRAIEQHDAFRREVSDAVEHFKRCYPGYQHASLFDRFVIAKPDPLVEAVGDALEAQGMGRPKHTTPELTEHLRTALANRGLEIREVE